MIRLFTPFICLFLLSVASFGQSLLDASGNAYLSNWTPAQNNNKFEPSIGNMTIKYRFEPDSLQCKVQMSMQWYLGNAVHYNKEVYKYPIVSQQEINNFSIIDLEIQADLYSGSQYIGKLFFNMGTTPKSGGYWGSNVTETKSWANLLSGVTSSSAKNAFRNSTSLKNLTIRKIVFGGEHQFKQSAYQKFVDAARTAETNQQWENALSNYQTAKKMQPTDRFVNGKVLELEQKLAKYQQFQKLGDEAYAKKEYLRALTAYQNAAQELAGQTHTQNRLQEIQKRISDYDAAKKQATQAFQEAKDVKTLIEVRKQFLTALTFLPIEKKAEIEQETTKIDALLESEYKHALEEAKLAVEHQEYAYAAEHYRSAMTIFPNRPNPKQQLATLAKPLQEKLTANYKQKLAEAKQLQEEKLELAAQAFHEQNEQCQLRSYEQQRCLAQYYTTVSRTIEQEVRQSIYANTSFQKAKQNCINPDCQINQQWETENQNATALLMAAKRKQQHFLHYKAATFKAFRDQYLNQSLTVNPENPAAFLFKAQVSESITDQMLWYHKVLEVNPNHAEAQNAVRQLEGKFMGELFTFVDRNRIDELHKALDLGLLKKAGNYQGQNIVEYVIVKDNAPMLALLLEQPTQLAASIDSNPNTLLYYALAKKATNCTDELLFNRQADPNFEIAGKEPLLIQAVSNRYALITEQLLKANANPYVSNSHKKTALMLALEAGDSKIVAALLNRYEISRVKNEEVFTALRVGNASILGHLLDKGIDANLKNARGQALIHLAILSKHDELSEVIINHGADLEMRDRDGNTALLLACKQMKEQIGQTLINKNARINLRNNTGESPLYLAVKNNLKTITALLLKKRASHGRVIEIAKMRNEQSVADRLAQAFSILGIQEGKSAYVNTALQIQANVGYLPKGNYPNALHEAAKRNKPDIFMQLIGQNPNRSLAPEGLSALHIAIAEKNVAIVKQLLDKKINLSSKTKAGLTPFHYAAKTGFVNGISLLKQHYDINSQDEQGNTALHHAVEGDQPAMIRTLISQGANPKIKNQNKWNPKKMAKKLKKKQLKKLF